MTNLIGISGKIGAGKTLFARLIRLAVGANTFPHRKWDLDRLDLEEPNLFIGTGWEIKAFATPLKKTVCIFLGCTMKQLEDPEFKKSKLGPQWANLGEQPRSYDCGGHNIDESDIIAEPTVRDFLQYLGTNALRNNVHPNIHINAAFAKYLKPFIMMDVSGGIPTQNINPSKWIFMDMRFPNEYEAIKSRGGICIRLHRITGPYDNHGHSSEWSLDSRDDWNEVINNNGTLEDLYEKAKYIVNQYKLS